MRYRDDSLLGTGVMYESVPFAIENVLGGIFPLPLPVHSLWENGQNSLVRNSGTQQTNAITLEISSKYFIQCSVVEMRAVQQCQLVNRK